MKETRDPSRESPATYISDLTSELEVPRDGILSRILRKDSQVNVTLFGFAAGEELSEHTAGSPAIVQILQGEADLTIAGEERAGGPGTWIYMPAGTSHSLVAKTPVIMLLLLLKAPARAVAVERTGQQEREMGTTDPGAQIAGRSLGPRDRVVGGAHADDR